MPVPLRHVNGEPISYVSNSVVSVSNKILARRMGQWCEQQSTHTHKTFPFTVNIKRQFCCKISEVLKVVLMKIQVFYNMALCTLLKIPTLR